MLNFAASSLFRKRIVSLPRYYAVLSWAVTRRYDPAVLLSGAALRRYTSSNVAPAANGFIGPIFLDHLSGLPSPREVERIGVFYPRGGGPRTAQEASVSAYRLGVTPGPWARVRHPAEKPLDRRAMV